MFLGWEELRNSYLPSIEPHRPRAAGRPNRARNCYPVPGPRMNIVYAQPILDRSIEASTLSQWSELRRSRSSIQPRPISHLTMQPKLQLLHRANYFRTWLLQPPQPLRFQCPFAEFLMFAAL